MLCPSGDALPSESGYRNLILINNHFQQLILCEV